VDVVDGAARACARPWPQTISTRARARAWHPTASRPRDSTTPTPHAINRDRRGAGRGVRGGGACGGETAPPQLPGSSGAQGFTIFFVAAARGEACRTFSSRSRLIGEALTVDAPKVERARAEAIVCMAGG